jgi:hypothetical protein
MKRQQRSLADAIGDSSRVQITDIPSFLVSLHSTAVDFYHSAPWKYIPGPWAIEVRISSPVLKGDIERVIVISGATNSNNRGLLLYSSASDYSRGYNNASVMLGFQESGNIREDIPRQFQEHQWPFVEGKRPRYPVFGALPGMGQPDAVDLVFFEAALPAIAAFITKAARMGGGGPPLSDVEAESTTASEESLSMSPADVLKALCSPETNDMIPSAARSLIGEFPCRQTIQSITGNVTASLQVPQTPCIG